MSLRKGIGFCQQSDEEMKNLFFSYMHNNKEGNILVFYTGKCLGKQLVEVDERFKSYFHDSF